MKATIGTTAIANYNSRVTFFNTLCADKYHNGTVTHVHVSIILYVP